MRFLLPFVAGVTVVSLGVAIGVVYGLSWRHHFDPFDNRRQWP